MKFGMLTVIERAKNNKSGKARWLCQCDCGKLTTVLADSLISGKTKSCGCYRKNVAGKNAPIKHGKSNTRLFNIWSGMKSRCYCKSNRYYQNYGGRGIIVCNEWINNFNDFYQWSINNGYSDDLTIDRIDNSGNYEPSNCRWATYQEQENNRRNTIYLDICGCRKPLSEWSEIVGISSPTIEWRMKNHWPFEQLFIEPNLNNKNLRRNRNA
jgi:hypothetical protein